MKSNNKEFKNENNPNNKTINDENNNTINEIKEKTNNNTRRITYSKKVAPSNIFFKKNNNSLNSKNELSNNQMEIKNIKKIKYIKNPHKLNSSFEGTKNLQMNNIFMNNNIFNNNFNYPDNNMTLLNPELSNNCYYQLNSNTSNANNLLYEINKPAAHIILNMNNNSTKSIKKVKLYNLNNSFNNNNYIVPINNDFFKGNNNIKFEDFIILEKKLSDIKYTLTRKNLIINECFEYINYYYNSTLYKNIDDLLKINNIESNDLKMCLGYNLLSIMICYNCSLELNIFEQTHLLLKEILESNYKNLVLIYEYIIKNIISNNRIDINNNIWILKMNNIINNYKHYEEKSIYNEYISLNKNAEMTIVEKIKINTNFIMNNCNIILTNIKTKNTDHLLIIFKSMNDNIYENIFFYFFNFILNIVNYKGSIVGFTLIQNNLLNNINIMVPYIKTKNIKNYSLVLDLEETLLHFNINNNNEGIVDIRPGTIKFLDDISQYYELIVFNEGEQKYTDILIDSIEENKIYFEHRLYREHIIIDNNEVVKDLNRIGRSLDKIIIIDNMPQNYKFQKNNGILIKSFWGNNLNDTILNDLANILIKIAIEGGDIRNGLIKYKNEIIDKITIGNNM